MFGVGKIFFVFWKVVSYAQQDKNVSKIKKEQ